MKVREDARLGWFPAAQLTRWQRNPNGHPPAQLDQLRAAMVKRGFTAPVMVAHIVDEGIHEVRAGHGRLLAHEQLLAEDPAFVPCNAPEGTPPGEVPVYVVSFANRVEADQGGLADNRITELAEPDDALIVAMIREWDALGESLDGLGLDEKDLDAILGEVEPEAVDHDYKRIGNTRKGARPPVLTLSLLVPTESDVLDRAFEAAGLKWPMLARGQLLVAMLRSWLGEPDADT